VFIQITCDVVRLAGMLQDLTDAREITALEHTDGTEVTSNGSDGV
jgi:hypothetical protein